MYSKSVIQQTFLHLMNKIEYNDCQFCYFSISETPGNVGINLYDCNTTYTLMFLESIHSTLKPWSLQIASGFFLFSPRSKLVVGSSLLNCGAWFESKRGHISIFGSSKIISYIHYMKERIEQLRKEGKI